MTDDREVLDRLTRIEVKLDDSLARSVDHENRIRRLERALWLASGAASAGGGVVGAMISKLASGGAP